MVRSTIGPSPSASTYPASAPRSSVFSRSSAIVPWKTFGIWSMYCGLTATFICLFATRERYSKSSVPA